MTVAPVAIVSRLVPRAYRPALASAAFRRLLLGYGLSYLGDGMSVVAVSWLALDLAAPKRRALVVGAAVAAYSIPGAVGGLALGRWLRRVDPRRLILANAALRAACFGAVPLVWAMGALSAVPYVLLLAASSLLNTWDVAGKFALVARHVPEDARLAANALVSTEGQGSVIVGPAVAGLLVAVTSPAVVIGLDALSFVLLALIVGRLPAGDAAAGAAAGGVESAGSTANVGSAGNAGSAVEAARPASGLRLLLRHPQLAALLCVTWFFYFLYGPVEVALPLYVAEELRAPASVLGTYWTAFAVGAVVGGLASGMLRRFPLWPVVLAIVAGWGMVLLPFGVPAPLPVTVSCFAAGGLIYGPFAALTYTLFQAETPPDELTSVLAARGAVVQLSSPVGTALGGPLAGLLGARGVLFTSGAATVLLAAVATAVITLPYGRPRRAGPVRDAR